MLYGELIAVDVVVAGRVEAVGKSMLVSIYMVGNEMEQKKCVSARDDVS